MPRVRWSYVCSGLPKTWLEDKMQYKVDQAFSPWYELVRMRSCGSVSTSRSAACRYSSFMRMNCDSGKSCWRTKAERRCFRQATYRRLYNLYSNLIPATERYVALSHFRKKSTGLAPNTSEARHKRCEVLLVTRTLTLRQIGVVAGLFKFVDERIQKSRFEVGSAFTLFRYRGTFKRCLLRWPQN